MIKQVSLKVLLIFLFIYSLLCQQLNAINLTSFHLCYKYISIKKIEARIILKTTKTNPIIPRDSIIHLIDCQKALKSTDKIFIGHHIAALKEYDANYIRVGQLETSIKYFLDKAIANKEVMNEQILYKFPLYKELGDYQLIDEPRTNYDFYGVFVDKQTHTITSKVFFYYGKVKFRPIYEDFESNVVENIEEIVDKAKSHDRSISENAILDLSFRRGSTSSIKFLHHMLKNNIKKGIGNERKGYAVENDYGTEFGVDVSQNETLIRSLSELEALEAVPTLMSLLSKSENEIGITHQNLLYFFHNITSEPIKYYKNGKVNIYPEENPLKEYLVKNRK